MSEEFLNEREAEDRALAIVNDIPDEELETEVEQEATSEDTSASPADKSPSQEDGPSEQDSESDPETVLTAPRSWRHEAKELFDQLPPELQRQVAERETQQEQAFNRVVNEQTQARQKYDTEAQQVAQARTYYANQVQGVAQLLNVINPLAQFESVDWDKLNRENPTEYVNRKHDYDKTVAMISGIAAEQQRLQQENHQQTLYRGGQYLVEKLPEWREPTKREQIIEGIKKVGNMFGFRPEELEAITDPRVIIMANEYAKTLARVNAKESLSTKRTVTPPRVIKTQAARDKKAETSQHVRNLKQRAIRSDRDDDKVAAIMAALGDN